MNMAFSHINFAHRQSAHCETGVISNLLAHYGMPISEAMAFGIGGGLFFAHIPLIKLFGMPLTTYRSLPGGILKRACKELGVKYTSTTFRSPEAAMDALDAKLVQGSPVGLQTGAYWLPYFPVALRFHFNGHNLVAYGKTDEGYLISDPVIDTPVVCPAENLKKSRFSKGELAPRGRMYHLTSVPAQVDLSPGIAAGLRFVCFRMLSIPLPIFGVRGIRYLADRLEKWPQNMDHKTALHFLGNVIRMQEEIGTGGAGFRFIFAAFLQEAGQYLAMHELQEKSGQMTEIGDLWREFAMLAARMCKGRAEKDISFALLADILRNIARREETLFRELDALIRSKARSLRSRSISLQTSGDSPA